MIRFTTGEEIHSNCNYAIQSDFAGVQRQALRIEIDAGHGHSYAQVAELFRDGARFSVVEQTENAEKNQFDKFEYIVAGDITDHRDGRFTVLMGKLTEMEELETENAELLRELCGGEANGK